MKPRHRFLIAHPSEESRAREHASALAKKATRKEDDLITVEVALRDDCPPGQMFLMYYLPRPTWLVDAVLGGDADLRSEVAGEVKDVEPERHQH